MILINIKIYINKIQEILKNKRYLIVNEICINKEIKYLNYFDNMELRNKNINKTILIIYLLYLKL